MGFIHHPHQIHVQVPAAGLLVHHGVIGRWYRSRVVVSFTTPDGEIEIDVAVFMAAA